MPSIAAPTVIESPDMLYKGEVFSSEGAAEKKFGRILVLVSRDEIELKSRVGVWEKGIGMSGLIGDMLGEIKIFHEDDTDEEDEKDWSMPLPNVKEKRILKLFLKYAHHHWNDRSEVIPKPLPGDLRNYISDWDAQFLQDVEDAKKTKDKYGMKLDHPEEGLNVIVELLMAANFLNSPDLMALLSAKIMDMNKQRSPDELKALFGIESDFTDEEMEKIISKEKICDEEENGREEGRIVDE